MILIKDILVNKDIAINESESIKFAIETMHKSSHGVVAVLLNKKVVGVITERDIINIINDPIDMDRSVKSFFQFHNIITINESRSLEYALHVLIDNSIRRLIVVDDTHTFVGIVTQDGVLKHLDDDVFKSNIVISNFLNKNMKIITIKQSKSIDEGFRLMNSHTIGSVIVVDDNLETIGIVTERDSISILKSDIDMSLPISKIMSSPIISVSEDALVKDTVELMNLKNIRRVLVLESDSNIPISILTTRDIAKNLQGHYTQILESKLKNMKTTLNQMGESIIEIFEDNNMQIIQWMNDKARENFGQMIDANILELIPEHIWKTIYEGIKRDETSSKYKVKIKEMSFELMCSQHFVNAKETHLIILRDISSFENAISSAKVINTDLEEQVKQEVEKNQKHEILMFQQSRLAQMGEMISMIAHQWRQPLNNLSILTQTIYFRYKRGRIDDELMNEFNEDSKKQIKLMSTTIDDFRNFFKPDKQREKFYLDIQINQTIELLKPIFHQQNIKIKIDMTNKIEFFGFPSEFSQSLVNIFNNAKDALVEEEVENRTIYVSLKQKDKKIILEIKDNAGGIPEEIIEKIFDPYFSTKKNKNGTGLGLYMTKLIIEEHMGGSISVTNEKSGACFSITLN